MRPAGYYSSDTARIASLTRQPVIAGGIAGANRVALPIPAPNAPAYQVQRAQLAHQNEALIFEAMLYPPMFLS